MKTWSPETIFVESGATVLPSTSTIISAFPSAKVEEISVWKECVFPADTLDGSIREAKRHLGLAVWKGAFVKPFPIESCGPDSTEEEHYYLVHASGCIGDCHYCFLQEYLDNHLPTVFVNRGNILAEVREFQDANKSKRVRLHTGHLSDGVEPLTWDGFLGELISSFRDFPGATLECRTKFAVDIDVAPADNVVFSWTLAPDEVSRIFEPRTAPVSERITAMQRAAENGFRVGVRLDPVVRYDGWRDGYSKLIDEVFGKLPAGSVESIDMGVLRFKPELGTFIKKRRAPGPLLLDESVPSADGKLRYARPIRVRMYRALLEMIDRRAPVKLVMEESDVLEAVWR